MTQEDQEDVDVQEVVDDEDQEDIQVMLHPSMSMCVSDYI